MRVTLIHNPTAGDASRSASHLRKMLRDAGHEVTYASTRKAWKKALKLPADLVVAAGGDGTVRKVALALAGRETPMAILAIGNANNVAKTISTVGDAREFIASWDRRTPRPFDLGLATAPWGRELFVEAFGGGFFATAIREGETAEKETPILGHETDRALHLLSAALRNARALPWTLRVDGREVTGDYLAVEVLNVRFAGANVPLAPDADPGDGLLDVALVAERHRDDLVRYLDARIRMSGEAKVPSVEVVRGRVIEVLTPREADLRIDDQLWPANPRRRGSRDLVTVTVQRGAVRVIEGDPPKS